MLELNELERRIRGAEGSRTLRFVLPPALPLRVVATAQRAIDDLTRAIARAVDDGDAVVDFAWRLHNVSRALSAATKVRIPKRIRSEPAVKRFRAIAERALAWDNEADHDMRNELGYGLDGIEPNDDPSEDFDPPMPKVGDEFEDAFGSRYRIVALDDEEGEYARVELVQATETVVIDHVLARALEPKELREARVRTAMDAADR